MYRSWHFCWQCLGLQKISAKVCGGSSNRNVFACDAPLWAVFFRALSLSDYLAAAFLLFVLIRFIRASRDEKRNMLSFGKDCLTEGGALTALLMTAVVTICVGSKLVSWWDDYNFWATDVKSIYYLDGFAGKYTNVAPEFGDYPPATQMIKWWFLHFHPDSLKKG